MVYILMGKSASGKDRTLNRLIAGKPVKGIKINTGCLPIITCTTRPMREREVDGRDYHFIDKELFKRMIASGEFLEWRCYHTLVKEKHDDWYYGTPWSAIKNYKDQDYISIVDAEGAKAYLDSIGEENCTVYYIDASDDVRTIRAKRRGSFDQSEWNRRLKDDDKKFSEEILSEFELRLKEHFIRIDNNKDDTGV